MESLLIVTDPIDEQHSVQFDYILSLCRELKGNYEIQVFSTYFSKEKAEMLNSEGVKVIRSGNVFWINRFLKFVGLKNESMLWVESWAREAFLGRNHNDLKGVKGFDKVVNLSGTIPVSSSILLLQGRSFYYTVRDMARTNFRIRFPFYFLGYLIKRKDMQLIRRLVSDSEKLATNAEYLSNFYKNLGYNVTGTIYTAKDFSKFIPRGSGSRDYILTYIGKETDFEPILELAKEGVPVKGFGSKIPVGVSLSRIKESIDYLGFVTEDQLIELYSNALFTIFPFMEEPFGYVPIESMACGTPVLSYRRQGPGETILDGRTGWLVSNKEEIVRKALEIWKKGHNLKREDCVVRASEYTPKRAALSILNLLHDA